VEVQWDDGTVTVEPVGAGRPWEWMAGTAHYCQREQCVCPDDGEGLLYHRASDTHACPRTGCRYMHGLEGVRRGGIVGL